MPIGVKSLTESKRVESQSMILCSGTSQSQLMLQLSEMSIVSLPTKHLLNVTSFNFLKSSIGSLPPQSTLIEEISLTTSLIITWETRTHCGNLRNQTPDNRTFIMPLKSSHCKVHWSSIKLTVAWKEPNQVQRSLLRQWRVTSSQSQLNIRLWRTPLQWKSKIHLAPFCHNQFKSVVSSQPHQEMQSQWEQESLSNNRSWIPLTDPLMKSSYLWLDFSTQLSVHKTLSLIGKLRLPLPNLRR